MSRTMTHFVYNDLLTGQFDSAAARIAQLRQYGELVGDEGLLAMLHAADTYRTSVMQWLETGEDTRPHDPRRLHDDYARQRLVAAWE